MASQNTSSEYSSTAKWLHWSVAIGIFVLLWLGLQQAGMERGPEKSELRALHASVALIVLVLMTVRLVWRFLNGVPAHPDGIPGWQRVTSTLVHWGLYISVFVQLISGSITVASGGNSLPFFGLFSIALPIVENEESHEFWEGIHEFSWIIIAAFLTVHVLGALYNHFVLKNDVLRRMTIGVRKGS
jgi:cytochrome b561